MSNGNDNEYACACFEHTNLHVQRAHMLRLYTHSYIVICTTMIKVRGGGGGGGGKGAIVPAAPMLSTLLVQMAYCHVYECTKCVTGTLENKRVESFWNHYVVEQYKSHVSVQSRSEYFKEI